MHTCMCLHQILNNDVSSHPANCQGAFGYSDLAMRIHLSIILISTLLTGCASMNASHESSPDYAMRVATYNIKHGRGMDGTIDLERTAATLTTLNADIIALQEVDEQARRSGGVDQAAWLAERLGMHAAYGSFMEFQGGRYGLAILSRRPIESHEAWRLPEGNEPRVALAARIPTDSGTPITAIAVHFDWVEDDGYRFQQARETLRRIEALETPWIVFGDFNDVPGSRTMNAFEQIGRNADKPKDDAATFPADRPTIEIDSIITGPPNAWNSATSTVIAESLTSDHRPVVAELLLK